MNKLSFLGALLAASTVLATPAMAGISNFNAQPVGIYTSVLDGGVTYTFLGGDGRFDVEAASPGVPIDGNALISFRRNAGPAAFKATIASGFSLFSIGCGDFGADQDNCVLEAYDANNVLLDSDTFVVPNGSSTGGTMTVSSTSNIAYVLFYENSPNFPGAIYWDNARFETFSGNVPVPQSAALVLLALGGLVATRRQV